MCTQCVTDSDDHPTQQLLLMQRALHNTQRTENGRENWNNKLISPLFENITTLAQLHQFTRVEGTTEESSYNSVGHGTQVPQETLANVDSSVMNTCHFTRTNSRGDVSCMAVIPIDLNPPPQPCEYTLVRTDSTFTRHSTLSRLHLDRYRLVMSRDHQPCHVHCNT